MINFNFRTLLAVGALLVSQQASALTITAPATLADCTADPTCWYRAGANNAQPTADEIETLVGTTTDLSDLYKAEVGTPVTEAGTFAGSYDTTFSNTATDPQDAAISYVGAPSFDSVELYLSVKDGNSTPSLYIFDVSSWDRTSTIDLVGFWPSNGAISNIAFWGGTDTLPPTPPTPPVPTPGPATLGLIGLGLFGLGVTRRRQAT